jgi:molybdopterin molybdotransferase
MSLVPVEEALARLIAGIEPVEAEDVSLYDAGGRVLAEDVAATRDQPPFPASAMDGYAVRAADTAEAGARLRSIGESRAGARFAGALEPGTAVRIFTGAPVPEGADAILIQENATAEGEMIVVREGVKPGQFVRPAGLDFRAGEVLLRAGRRMEARALALAASMNRHRLSVRRRPQVAMLATGDELVPPGAEPGPDQIVSSNAVGVGALVADAGGDAIDLGIARDRVEDIVAAVDKARGADVLVVIGGASVGEHDLVQEALTASGMELDFWQIAMRPGKPLMVGRLGATRVLGLPGNPVSAIVCGLVFLKPLVRALTGLPPEMVPETARLGAAMAANDRRQDYVRARLALRDGTPTAVPFDRQDSSMLATLATADALIIRPPHAPAAPEGAEVPILRLDPAG